MAGFRTISPQEVRALKAATEGSYRLGGGVTGLEDFTRVTVSKLSEYASFDERHDKRLMPIDVAIEADRRAQSPVIVKAMAQVLGYQLVPLRAEARATEAVCERDAHILLSEAMDVSNGLIRAFDDGTLDALERKKLRVELRELIRAGERILVKLDQVEGAP